MSDNNGYLVLGRPFVAPQLERPAQNARSRVSRTGSKCAATPPLFTQCVWSNTRSLVQRMTAKAIGTSSFSLVTPCALVGLSCFVDGGGKSILRYLAVAVAVGKSEGVKSVLRGKGYEFFERTPGWVKTLLPETVRRVGSDRVDMMREVYGEDWEGGEKGEGETEETEESDE